MKKKISKYFTYFKLFFIKKKKHLNPLNGAEVNKLEH